MHERLEAESSREPLEALVALVPRAADHLELNAGTLSPTPQPVQEAVDRLRRMQAGAPTDFWVHQIGPLIAEARAVLGAFLNAPPDELFLLPNVTSACNHAIQSLRFAPGDELLTTDHEYGAMNILLHHVAQRDGASVRVVALPQEAATPGGIVDCFASSVSPRTRLIFFSHVTSPTGLRLPAAGIVAAVRARAHADCFVIIDGAHAPGMIDVDLSAIAADAYGANCHKWMMAPCGAGFLHAAPRLKQRLRPLILSWGDDPAVLAGRMDEGWFEPNTGQDFGSTRLQYRLEYQGVYDRTPQLALPAAVAFLRRVGLERIQRRWAALARLAIERVQAVGGLRSATPEDESCRSAMPLFDVPDPRVATALRRRLWQEHRMFAPVSTAGGRVFFRISTAWFNTEGEIDRMARAVGEVVRSA